MFQYYRIVTNAPRVGERKRPVTRRVDNIMKITTSCELKTNN